MIKERKGKKLLIFGALITAISWGSTWGSGFVSLEEAVTLREQGDTLLKDAIYAIDDAAQLNRRINPETPYKILSHTLEAGLFMLSGASLTKAMGKKKKPFNPFFGISAGITLGTAILFKKYIGPQVNKEAEIVQSRLEQSRRENLFNIFSKITSYRDPEAFRDTYSYYEEEPTLKPIAQLSELEEEIKKIHYYEKFRFSAPTMGFPTTENINDRINNTICQFMSIKGSGFHDDTYQSQLEALRLETRKQIEWIRMERQLETL